MGEGARREGAQGARAAAAWLGGRRGGWTGGRPPRRCTSGFVGASVFVRRTNGERTRRWALERRKIHISSTALISQRPPAHFPRRRSRAPRSAAAACPLPPCCRRRRRARRAPQRLASSSLGWRWADAGAQLTAATPLPAPRPARLPVASHTAGWLHRAGWLQDVRGCEDGRAREQRLEQLLRRHTGGERRAAGGGFLEPVLGEVGRGRPPTGGASSVPPVPIHRV